MEISFFALKSKEEKVPDIGQNGFLIYSFITAIRHRVSPQFIGSRNCVPMAFTAESPSARASKPQGSSERVLLGRSPWTN